MPLTSRLRRGTRSRLSWSSGYHPIKLLLIIEGLSLKANQAVRRPELNWFPRNDQRVIYYWHWICSNQVSWFPFPWNLQADAPSFYLIISQAALCTYIWGHFHRRLLPLFKILLHIVMVKDKLGQWGWKLDFSIWWHLDAKFWLDMR